jgi:hypothetical protein
MKRNPQVEKEQELADKQNSQEVAEMEKVKLNLLQETDELWKAYLAYRNKHFSNKIKDHELQNMQGGHALFFPDKQTAQDFLQQQAKNGCKFLAVWVDDKGNHTDQYEFSCGTGDLYSGRLEEINAKLEADLKELEGKGTENDLKKYQMLKEGINEINRELAAIGKVQPTIAYRNTMQGERKKGQEEEERTEKSASLR